MASTQSQGRLLAVEPGQDLAHELQADARSRFATGDPPTDGRLDAALRQPLLRSTPRRAGERRSRSGPRQTRYRPRHPGAAAPGRAPTWGSRPGPWHRIRIVIPTEYNFRALRPVIVLDAWAALAALLNAGPARQALSDQQLHAPTCSTPKSPADCAAKCWATNSRPPPRGPHWTRSRRLAVTRYPGLPLAERVWELRENLTAYDATDVDPLLEALRRQPADRRRAPEPRTRHPLRGATVIPGRPQREDRRRTPGTRHQAGRTTGRATRCTARSRPRSTRLRKHPDARQRRRGVGAHRRPERVNRGTRGGGASQSRGRRWPPRRTGRTSASRCQPA